MAIKIPNIISTDVGKKTFDPLRFDTTPTDNAADAEFCIVSEFPTAIEVFNSDPYDGQMGSQLSRILSVVSMPRYNIYHTYAVNTPVPLTKKEPIKLWTKKGFRHANWGELQLNLINSLKSFAGKIIILMGDTPMLLLLESPKINSATTHRGSCYYSNDFPHLVEAIPDKIIIVTQSARSCTPAMNPLNQYLIMNDLEKAKALFDEPSLMIDNTVIHVNPTYHEIIVFLERVMKCSETSFDIEATPEFVTCFALTTSPEEGMSIPLMNNAGNMWTPEEELQIWLGLAKILADPGINIIAQNGMFDFMYMLRVMFMTTDAFTFDTMIAQHICWTDLPKSLAFLVSMYTYHNYYKDEGKLSHLTVIKDWISYWRYNGKDACYTHEIAHKLQDELVKFDAVKDMTYMMELHKPLMEMEWNGILTKQLDIHKQKIKYSNVLRGLQKALNRLTKKDLNTNSSKQMVAYFYGICMIKPYINRKTKAATCDAVALSRIARKKVKGSKEARLILKMRKYGKLVSTYLTVNVDEDNKLRCHHKITGTVSGRLSTEGTWLGTGTNLQNQPEMFKQYLIPDPDWILCEIDLCQAESHCVAYLCQDLNMINDCESGLDGHTKNASRIYKVLYDKVTKKQRKMGKKIKHARNYKMGPQTFSDNLAKEGIFKTKSECNILLKTYDNNFPGLPRWQQEITDTIYRTRMLHNMFGRPKQFLGMINNDMIGNAVSYIPQSTVAELLNRGSIKIANDIRLSVTGYDIDLLATVHDSNVFQFKITKRHNLLKILLIMQAHLTHTFYHKGRSFTIGLDAKIGFNWGKDMVEINEFTEEKVNAALKKIGV